MEAQRAKRREELRSPGAGERARERDGGRPICIVMQGEGARGREEKVKTAEADLECQDFEIVTMTAEADLACQRWAGARVSKRLWSTWHAPRGQGPGFRDGDGPTWHATGGQRPGFRDGSGRISEPNGGLGLMEIR